MKRIENEHGFSLSEVEILKALAKGISRAQIAVQMKMVEGSVETAVVRMLRRQKAANAAHLMAIAYESGTLKAQQS